MCGAITFSFDKDNQAICYNKVVNSQQNPVSKFSDSVSPYEPPKRITCDKNLHRSCVFPITELLPKKWDFFHRTSPHAKSTQGELIKIHLLSYLPPENRWVVGEPTKIHLLSYLPPLFIWESSEHPVFFNILHTIVTA